MWASSNFAYTFLISIMNFSVRIFSTSIIEQRPVKNPKIVESSPFINHKHFFGMIWPVRLSWIKQTQHIDRLILFFILFIFSTEKMNEISLYFLQFKQFELLFNKSLKYNYFHSLQFFYFFYGKLLRFPCLVNTLIKLQLFKLFLKDFFQLYPSSV